ncbi:uroporphyrinogen-III synthase [Nesterenkonia lutea]|uniref:Uroporphyrinogen-III synthase n=1 Tax=Nesterenkonia lutea TaxID=272919 RepID=A0ABR9JAR3_9MICC|nr:uroporphyrinogen-III synthase [Nesterenkonia lutea]MBE1523014.1 uroporphyrinogen-III synthase [Nesterenkonia lutea]
MTVLTSPDPSTQVPQTLAGFRIGITSDRRSEDLICAFQRRGAEVMHAPALRIVALTESVTLQRDTRHVIEAAPDFAIITTAYGMRRWAEAADAYGLGTELFETLDRAVILVRGPKARGAVRAAGLDDDGAAEDERTATVVDMLLARDVAGKTVALQQHGASDDSQIERIQAAGATVVSVLPYTWTKPDEDSDLLRMVDAVIDRQLDLVTFTAAPAVEAFLSVARQYNRSEALVEALRSDVVCAAVGAVTAGPLYDAGLSPIIPSRWRLGAMIKLVCDHLEEHHTLRITTRHGLVELRGSEVRLPAVSDDPVRLPPGPLSLLRALVKAEGAVLSREHLMQVLGQCDSEHALEMWVSRLRKSLPVPGLVSTVVKRGYRLTV